MINISYHTIFSSLNDIPKFLFNTHQPIFSFLFKSSCLRTNSQTICIAYTIFHPISPVRFRFLCPIHFHSMQFYAPYVFVVLSFIFYVIENINFALFYMASTFSNLNCTHSILDIFFRPNFTQ